MKQQEEEAAREEEDLPGDIVERIVTDTEIHREERASSR